MMLKEEKNTGKKEKRKGGRAAGNKATRSKIRRRNGHNKG